MNEKDKNCIKLIIGAIEKIEIFTSEITNATELVKHKLQHDAVLLNLIVIRDMISIMSQEVKNSFAEVDWSQTKVFEERVHNYYLGVDIEYLWRFINTVLPEFKKIMKRNCAE